MVQHVVIPSVLKYKGSKFILSKMYTLTKIIGKMNNNYDIKLASLMCLLDLDVHTVHCKFCQILHCLTWYKRQHTHIILVLCYYDFHCVLKCF